MNIILVHKKGIDAQDHGHQSRKTAEGVEEADKLLIDSLFFDVFGQEIPNFCVSST